MKDLQTAAQVLDEAGRYWRTSIVDIHPGYIALRGYPIEELIGQISFAQVIWLMLRGEIPGERQARLLESALVASVDHGPQAPSIAIARSAVSCGLPLNGAMASAINTLDDVHGGAGEQALQLYLRIRARLGEGAALAGAARDELRRWREEKGEYIPGLGHRFHPVDPRAVKLLLLVDEAREAGVVAGDFAAIARACEAELEAGSGKRIPLNIDGATAVIYGELGFPPPLARGIFVLSRSVGILAHAWEQAGRGERNKGPMPRSFPYLYEGPPERHLGGSGPSGSGTPPRDPCPGDRPPRP